MEKAILTEVEIERSVERATKFLGTLSRNSRVRDILVQGGYDGEEHERGWQLLLELLGYRAEPAFPAAGSEKAAQAAAVAELDRFDGPAFERSRFALERAFPEQAAYIFQGLEAKTGDAAVGAVNTFLDRVKALREGTDPERAKSRDSDRGAVALLERRRILDEKEDKRLRGLIAEARRLAETVPAPAVPDPARRQALAAELQAFLRDWRETARVLVTRRDYQIQLGLAERRPRASRTEDEDASEDEDADSGAKPRPAAAP